MSKTSKSNSYFVKNHKSLNLWAEKGGTPSLRQCQLGAYWAVWSHFTTSESPALVSLPTGAGKTALMMTLAFGLEAKRVLIITPAAVLRDQVRDDFSSLALLKTLNVVYQQLPSPKILSCDSERSDQAKWEEFKSYDVVVATPKTTSPAEKGVSVPPDGLFDLVLIDEAHHTPAPTWAALVKAFSKSRTVFLTATPFRRDRRKIQAPLVYHYSIGKALDQGIYRAVEYHAVKYDKNRMTQDSLLCKTAAKLLASEKKNGNDAKLLVRTDNTSWSARLVKAYQDQGLKVENVDYTKSALENQSIIDKVKSGKLDGMICVGMLGEGLDLPQLKIAVLHAAPRSLPFTLQFIGRVARTTSGQHGDAHIIAVPDEVRGEVRHLYKIDTNWKRLVPKLVDSVVGKVKGHASFVSREGTDILDLDTNELNPFFSVKVYKTEKNGVSFDNELELRDDTAICIHEIRDNQSVLIVITECESEPAWAKGTAIEESKLGLHVYYYDKAKLLLFEATTMELIAKQIRGSIVTKTCSDIEPSSLLQVMQNATKADYYMIGLRNALGKGASQPAYKTVMGAQVQAAVRPIDGKTFGPGHALARMSVDETRGVATDNSRIWAIQRGTIAELIDWCKGLAKELHKTNSKVNGLPQLSFLASPSTITKIHERPLAVILDERILSAKRKIEIDDGTNTFISQNVPCMTVVGFNLGVVKCELVIDPSCKPVSIECDLSAISMWKVTDTRNLRIHLEFSDTEITDGGFEEFANNYPLSFVMPAGGIIRGRTQWVPQTEAALLPIDCLQAKKWDKCDITCEDGPTTKGMLNVQDALEKQLKATCPSKTVIVKDHGAGEIADFIAVDLTNQNIAFYHCKATKSAKKGVRVDDLYDVLGQTCRCRTWVRYPNLLEELLTRIGGTNRRSSLVHGKLTDLKNAVKEFVSNGWTYSIIAVQPGLDCVKAINTKNVNTLIVSASEWLVGSEAKFTIWGS